MTKQSVRNTASLLAKIGITASLLWYFMRDINFSEVGAHFADMNLASFGIIILLLLVLVLIFSYRWYRVAGGTSSSLTLNECHKISFIAFLFTFTIPVAMGGDISRVYYLNKSQQHLGDSVSIIFIDRMIGGLAIALLLVASYPLWIGLVADDGLRAALNAVTLASLLVLLATPLLVFTARRFDLSRFSWLQLAASRLEYSMKGGLFFLLLLLSVLIQLAALSVAAVIAHAMHVTINGFAELLLILPVIVAGALPISFGGWGIREGAMVLALAQIGIDAESAFAVSVMYGLCFAAVGTPGIIFWLARGKKTKAIDSRD